MKNLKITLIFCLSLSFAKAQLSTDNKRVADVYFINNEYYAAAEYYKKALRISGDTLGFVVPYGFENKMKEETNKKIDYEYLVYQLATSLRLYKNFQDAEKWYAIANHFTNPKYALGSYYYAECLLSTSRYTEAISAYNNFIDKYTLNDGFKEKAKMAIASCKYALNEIKEPRMFKLSKLAADINLLGSNYAPAINSQTLYFTSSRPIGVTGKDEILASTANRGTRILKKQTPFINALYATNSDPSSSNISVRRVNINVKNMEAAAPTMHPNGNVMFFTAWINKDENKKNIYVSTKLDDRSWSDPKALGGEINVNGFNSIQPFVTNDGRYLLFASDRPGGSGKYDLWYATLRPDGTTSNAINMGTTINTASDDEAPYYNPKTKKLLFSSNGRIGLGGLDFYEAEGDFTSWETPKNMGYPFNSPKDDIYYTPIDEIGEVGYISSDRESVCCLEVFQVKKEYLNISGRVIDCKTLQPVPNAQLTLVGNDNINQSTLTNDDGKYSFRISSNKGFKISAFKDSYFAKSINYTYGQLVALDTLVSSDLCITPFKINKPIVLKNILYEFDSAELTDSSKIVLNNLYDIMVENKDIEIELGAHTDNIGKADYNLDLSNRRAQSCVDYLVSKGIDPKRMTSKGYGLTMPIAPNKFKNGKDNPEGRALNRRTEFKVTKK